MAGTLTLEDLPIRNERYFTRQKADLVDENIYERGAESVPFTTASLRFRGVAPSGPVSVGIYLNGALQETITTDAAGAFTFSVLLQKGKNQIHAALMSDGSLVGDTFFLNAYTFNTFLQAYAEEFSDYREFLDTIQQSIFIDDRTDWDGNATQISASDLAKNFGQYVSGRKRASQTREQYRDFLKDQFDAYFYAPTVRSLDEVASAYLGSLPTYRFYKNTFYALGKSLSGQTSLAPNGFKGKRKSGGAPADFLTMTWELIEMWMYRRWFRIEPGEQLLDANSTYWVYVDGDVVAHNQLQVKFLKQVVPEINQVIREITARSQTIQETDILVDTSGTKTGIANTLYVALDRIPDALTTVSGSVFGTLTSEAEIISGTGWVSLGVQFDASDVGDVTVTYNFKTEPRILARVTTNATEIVSIEFNSRIRRFILPDGSTNGMWGIQEQSRVNEFVAIFPNVHLLTAAERADFDQLASEVIPAHKLMLVGDDVLQPSTEYPQDLSAELGATRRGRPARLGVVSAELGATRRGFGGSVEAEAVEALEGELGATARNHSQFATSCIAEWLDSSPVKFSLDGRDTSIRGAVKPTDGYIYAFVADRYLYFWNGTVWSGEEDISGGAPFHTDTSDIVFQQNGDMMMSYHLIADGVYATYRPVGGGGDITTELADDTVDDVITRGRKSTSRYQSDDFAVAYVRDIVGIENAVFRVYDVSLNLWSSEVVLGTGAGGAIDGIIATLAPSDLNLLQFLIAHLQSLQYKTWPGGSWEAAMTVGGSLQLSDQAMVSDKDDSDVVYVVATQSEQASSSVDASVQFVERQSGGGWTTPVQISNFDDQGARFPDIVQDEKGNLIAIWTEYDPDVGKRSVWLRCRPVGETLWSPATKVADSLSEVAIGDTFPRGLNLPKKAVNRNYTTVPVMYCDDDGVNAASYWRRGVRGI